jgi:flagellar protein FlgJ
MVGQLSRAMQQPNGKPVIPSAGNAPGLPLNPKPDLKYEAVSGLKYDPAPSLKSVAAPDVSPAVQIQPAAIPVPAAATRRGDTPAHVESFVQRMLPHAQEASASSGIPASFMLGQAALETGWGRAEIRGSDGQSSHNLFGIKAGGSWTGRTVDVTTTEYVNGKPQKQVDSFRAYDSYADSFRDYANMLRGNARYQDVVAAGQDAAGFAQGLQQAGYATDPNYAQKLRSVIRLVETG